MLSIMHLIAIDETRSNIVISIRKYLCHNNACQRISLMVEKVLSPTLEVDNELRSLDKVHTSLIRSRPIRVSHFQAVRELSVSLNELTSELRGVGRFLLSSNTLFNRNF
jgi:hypothetical protein